KMKIEHYSFGTITIDGKSYTSDVIIYPERVDSSWWRKQGHSLHIVDLKDVILAGPEILIVGTGHSGAMVVPEETLSYLKSKGIDVHIARTDKAVELFNKFQKNKKTIAALHLTC
ncbi:MAG TPA: MTH938/NDUFAF3 family protein, partial [Thermodesulfovibrionales bacterium]|nr:MTH938/NDUFAF3 family protein [Thermodesulfovibrionales bacterium]